MVRCLNAAVAIAILFAPALADAKPATSRWAVFEAMDEGTIYIDPASVVRQGNSADMWVLIDYKKPQADQSGKQVQSDTLHYRYDCNAKSFTILTSSAHSGPMASGQVMDVNADAKPSPVPPGTTAEDMWKRACTGAK